MHQMNHDPRLGIKGCHEPQCPDDLPRPRTPSRARYGCICHLDYRVGNPAGRTSADGTLPLRFGSIRINPDPNVVAVRIGGVHYLRHIAEDVAVFVGFLRQLVEQRDALDPQVM